MPRGQSVGLWPSAVSFISIDGPDLPSWTWFRHSRVPLAVSYPTAWRRRVDRPTRMNGYMRTQRCEATTMRRCVLGAVEVIVDGQALDIRRPQQRAVLALLLLDAD